MGPCGPVSPLSPLSPLSPFPPVAPFKFLKAKVKVRADDVPPNVTVTEGVPILASIVAEALVIVAALPVSPLSPFAPSKAPLALAIANAFSVAACKSDVAIASTSEAVNLISPVCPLTEVTG